jgi:hypothetical protein
MADPSFRNQIYNYYKAEPYWDEDEGVRTTTREREKTFRGGGGL